MTDEFDQAVLCSYNVGQYPEDVKKRAVEYCSNLQRSPNGWAFCLEKFFQPTRIEIKFFCLVVIQDVIFYRYESLTDQDKTRLKASLMNWVREYIPNNPTEDQAIKNKYAQILAILFRNDYPDRWPSFFTDLFGILFGGPVCIDMFLRIIRSVDEEVLSKTVQRQNVEVAVTNNIKEAMKAEGAVQKLVDTWYQILETYGTAGTHNEICNLCLDSISRFINWIDISFITSDKFIFLFYKFLNNVNLREKILTCFFELIYKGMADPVAKISLFGKLRISQLLSTVSMDDEGDFLDEAAKVVNTMGMELLLSAAKLNPQQQIQLETVKMVEEALSLLFKFMNNDDDDISFAVFGFATTYLNTMKTSPSVDPTDHFDLMLQIIRRKMKYQDDFDFSARDEEEAEFQKYRKEVAHLMQMMMKIIPDRVAQFVHGSLEMVIQNLTSLTFSDVEVTLYMFYVMGDGISMDLMTKLEPFWTSEITLLASSNISTYNHQAVTLQYFEVISRFSKFIPNDPEVLKNILVSFLDGRGIRNPTPMIRSRCCYLLYKFLKTQKVVNLVPFVESILLSLKELLVISTETRKIISFDDQLNLFDALGTIVGQAGTEEAKQRHLATIIEPLHQQILAIMSEKLYLRDTPDNPVYTIYLVQMIHFIGSFSKGFNGQKMAIFSRTLDLVVELLTLLPQVEEIRAKSIFYLHRMIACIGEEVLPRVQVEVSTLVNHCNVKDMAELIRLINQLITEFKEKMIPTLQTILVPLLTKLFAIMSELGSVTPNVSAPKSEAEREILEVQKHYYLFVSTIINTNLASIFTQVLPDVLKTVLIGCTEYRDLNIVKQCYTILNKMVEGGDANFNLIIFEQVAPLLLKEPFRPEFNLNDGQTNLVLAVMIQLEKSIMLKCREEFTRYLIQILLPSMQWPSQVSEEYVTALQSLDAKQFKAFFLQFAAKYKSGKK